jgi:hypothetical protein
MVSPQRPPVGANMPEPDSINTAISQGVERALTRLFTSPDLTDAIRQGVRDGIWHLGAAANATDAGDTEQSHGHAD